MPDYPDFCSPVTPGQVTELDPSYTLLWLAHYQQEIAGSGEWSISIEPADADWWYKPEYVTVRVGADYDFRVLITLNGRAVAYIDARNYVELPLHANPALDIGYGDVLEITIENLESSTRQFDVAIHGLKRYLPGGNVKCPMAGFSASPITGSPPLSVTFTDESWRFPTAWLWDFGDGSTYGTDQNPTHEYDTEGTYSVSLKASNAVGYDISSISNYIVVTSTPDLTTFTEYDPSGCLTITTTRVTFANAQLNYYYHAVKDYGSDHFNTLSTYFTLRINTIASGGHAIVLAFANAVGDSRTWGSDCVWVAMYRTDGGAYQIRFARGDAAEEDLYAASSSTTYYCHLSRAAGSTTAYLYIYSNPERTVLLDTLVLTGLGAAKYRYMYVAASRYYASSAAVNGYGESYQI